MAAFRRPDLPLEILSEIVDYVPQKELYKLARTSRAFNEVCTRLLYRELVLHSGDAVKGCVETLAFNEHVARNVKRLQICVSSMKTSSVFSRTLRAAFRNIAPTLVTLQLAHCHLDLVSIFKRMSFPRLKTFQTAEDLTPDLAIFLLAHPDLETLGMGKNNLLTEKSRSGKGCHREMRIEMRSLRDFEGPHDSLHIFLPESRTERIALTSTGDNLWRPENVEKMLNGMASSTIPVKRLAFHNDFYYPLNAFQSIAEKLHHLTTLSFVCMRSGHRNLNGSVVRGLLRVLPNLPFLHRLEFGRHGRVSDNTPPHLEMDHKLLLEFTARRDTLASVQVPSGVSWWRLKEHGEWIPLLPELEGLHWWFKKTGLLNPLQVQVFQVVATSCMPPNQEADTGLSREAKNKKTLGSIRRATAKLINQAFGLSESERNPTADTSESTSKSAEEVPEERLQIPVHGNDGKVLKPYGNLDFEATISMTAVWDTFVSTLGFMSLYPIEIHLPTTLMIQIMTNTLEDVEVPLLDDQQKEMFSFFADLIWSSLHGDAMEVGRYLRDPENELEGKGFYLSISSLDMNFPSDYMFMRSPS